MERSDSLVLCDIQGWPRFNLAAEGIYCFYRHLERKKSKLHKISYREDEVNAGCDLPVFMLYFGLK